MATNIKVSNAERLNALARAGAQVVTNDLKNGDHVLLAYGDTSPWQADIADNARGDTRLCKVYGWYTELGSVYSHDIRAVQVTLESGEAVWYPITHTPAQKSLRVRVAAEG